MTLWVEWLQTVRSLRPACSRSRTFFWMVFVLMGLCSRADNAGVTSFVRVLNFRGEAYWSRIIERAARSFENYVIAKMAENGYNNDYLANVKAIEEFGRDKGRYPYLKDEELKPVVDAFDNLFGEMKTRETSKGTEL